MHFGENQLSPNSISFSLLSAPHPRLFQQASVRSSTSFHRGFNLDTDRSSLTSLCVITRRLILQKAYRHIHLNLRLNHAPIACRHTGSGLFTPLPGCFSPFPHGTLLYRSYIMFSLRPWSAQIQTEFHVLRPTQVSRCSYTSFAYGAFTLLDQLSQNCSARHIICNCNLHDPTTPVS